MWFFFCLQIEAGTPGKLRVTAQTVNGSETITEEYNTVVMAIGRDAFTSGIGLENTGVQLAKWVLTAKFKFPAILLCEECQVLQVIGKCQWSLASSLFYWVIWRVFFSSLNKQIKCWLLPVIMTKYIGSLLGFFVIWVHPSQGALRIVFTAALSKRPLYWKKFIKGFFFLINNLTRLGNPLEHLMEKWILTSKYIPSHMKNLIKHDENLGSIIIISSRIKSSYNKLNCTIYFANTLCMQLFILDIDNNHRMGRNVYFIKFYN